MCKEEYRCEDCGITVCTIGFYKRHLETLGHKKKVDKANKKEYPCECGMILSSEYFYEQHLKSNTHAHRCRQIRKKKNKEANIKEGIHCEDCDVLLGSINFYNVHLKSKIHKERLQQIQKDKDKAAKELAHRTERELLFKKNRQYSLELKNQAGEVVGVTRCEKAVYFYVIVHGYTVHLSVQGYVHICGIMNGKYKMERFNRWIYYVFYKNKKTPRHYVDHKNGKKLDNTIKNLREISKLDNSNNRHKQKNVSSKYYGVSKCHHQWQAQLRYKKINICFVYNKETHAAYHYDLMVKEHNLQNIKKLNKIKKPKDFVMTVKKAKKDGLPKCIMKTGKTFGYVIERNYKRTIFNGFLTPESANVAYQAHIKQIKDDKEKKLLAEPIKRNNRGDAIIELFNKKGEKVGEQVVDDDQYYKLIIYSWHRTSQYSAANINGQKWIMSRFLMNCQDEDMFVDHWDGNPINNKISNLRIVTLAQNNQNKKASKNSGSIYSGVHYCKPNNRWKTSITLNYEILYNKSFKTELEAAQAREAKVIEINKTLGTYYRLNFPE